MTRGFRNMLQNGRNKSNFLTKEPKAFNLCYQSKWRHHYNPLLRDHCASPERRSTATLCTVYFIYIYIYSNRSSPLTPLRHNWNRSWNNTVHLYHCSTTKYYSSVAICKAVTVLVVNTPVFLDMQTFGLVYRYQRFGRTFYVHLPGSLTRFLILKTAGSIISKWRNPAAYIVT
jgi:hypothetical protein